MESIINQLSNRSLWIVCLMTGFLGLQQTHAQLSVQGTSGMKVVVDGTMKVEMSGDWDNDGTLTPGTSQFKFTGDGTQDLTNASGSFYNIVVDKAAGNVKLKGDIAINGGTFSLLNGDADLNSYILTLDATASLSETTGNTVKGDDGYITTTRSLNAPSSDNVAGMGIEISTTSNLGNTEVRRGHYAQFINGLESIDRYFEFLPTNSSGNDATLVFHYDDSELNGNAEADLELYKSTDGGQTWTSVGGALNTSSNTMTATTTLDNAIWTLCSPVAALVAPEQNDQAMTESLTESPSDVSTLSTGSTVATLSIAPNFNIYPNPARTTTTIDLRPFEDHAFTLQVHNNFGQLLFQKSFDQGQQFTETLDLSNYQDGLYFISIDLNNDTRLTKKLVVQNN